MQNGHNLFHRAAIARSHRSSMLHHVCLPYSQSPKVRQSALSSITFSVVKKGLEGGGALDHVMFCFREDYRLTLSCAPEVDVMRAWILICGTENNDWHVVKSRPSIGLEGACVGLISRFLCTQNRVSWDPNVLRRDLRLEFCASFFAEI